MHRPPLRALGSQILSEEARVRRFHSGTVEERNAQISPAPTLMGGDSTSRRSSGQGLIERRIIGPIKEAAPRQWISRRAKGRPDWHAGKAIRPTLPVAHDV